MAKALRIQDVVVSSDGMRKLFLSHKHIHKRISTSLKGNQLVYSWKRHKLATAFCSKPMITRGDLWQAPLVVEKAIDEFIVKNSKEITPSGTVLLSGDALTLMPSGGLFIYGSEEHVKQLCEDAVRNSPLAFPLCIPFRDVMGFNGDRLSMQDYIRSKALESTKSEAAAGALKREFEAISRHIPDGIRNITHLVSAFCPEVAQTDLCFVSLLTHPRNVGTQREPISIRIPYCKRTLMEPSHICADRAATGMLKLKFNVTYDLPATYGFGTDKLIFFMFKLNDLNDTKFLKKDALVPYASRFHALDAASKNQSQ
jgi:hypothetical protein